MKLSTATTTLLMFLASFTLLGSRVSAQELNCGVQIQTPQLRVVDPKIFETLEETISNFMNNRAWTSERFKLDERIDCELIITISEELSSDRFRAQVSIQSRRPVYGSDYETVLINYVDKDCEFQYAEYQTLEFNETVHTNNLTSMLAFYAYVIIGMDYDSFEKKGGTPYFLKAQSIVNNAQNAPEKGWKPYDGVRNRYWMVDDLLSPRLATFRDVIYDYHRTGLDNFSEDQISPIAAITECLNSLNRVYSTKPNSMAMQLFFNAKSDEIVGIYSKAPPKDKTRAIGILNRIDASNSTKYRKILSGGGGR